MTQLATPPLPIPQPLLYHNLQECKEVLTPRQQKRVTSFDVTVTDINTNHVVTHYSSSHQNIPIGFLYYQVRAEWIHHHAALVHTCAYEYKTLCSAYQNYRTLWYTKPEHPLSARQLALSHLAAIRVETTRSLHRLKKWKNALKRLALTKVSKLPFKPRALFTPRIF